MLKNLLIIFFALYLPCQVSYAQSSTEGETVGQSELLAVDVNTASAEEMAAIFKGIGLKKAQAIVDYRNEHGSFKSAQELTNVKGIGLSLLERNSDYIHLQ
ncbi:ComEA family DNA-binding protein [Vibrio quintilis]|uniref:ComE operon protein 1 n=1 Tax=Vibrio quintilis TaxID=1117707 RepID=A0A1M7YQK6_9VIBR|nr:ComEA family DNA-binding protein [Vibrio quintilis]SHO54902.1 ComE operon protein 1 [Vibrio quintilis]